MGDPYSYIREGEDMICSTLERCGGCLSTPGSSIGKSITKTERLELDRRMNAKQTLAFTNSNVVMKSS